MRKVTFDCGHEIMFSGHGAPSKNEVVTCRDCVRNGSADTERKVIKSKRVRIPTPSGTEEDR